MYYSVLDRLAHYLKNVLFELGQLVQKQHAVMCQGYFTRLWNPAAAHKRNIGNSVVWRTERSCFDDSVVGVNVSRYGIYFCYFYCFLLGKRRKY